LVLESNRSNRTKAGQLVSHQLLVECKSSGKPVGIDEVRGFSRWSALTAVGRRQFLAAVSMAGFTKEARDFAKASGVKLTTLQELSLKSFDPEFIVGKAIEWYENDALSRHTLISLVPSTNWQRDSI